MNAENRRTLTDERGRPVGTFELEPDGTITATIDDPNYAERFRSQVPQGYSIDPRDNSARPVLDPDQLARAAAGNARASLTEHAQEIARRERELVEQAIDQARFAQVGVLVLSQFVFTADRYTLDMAAAPDRSVPAGTPSSHKPQSSRARRCFTNQCPPYTPTPQAPRTAVLRTAWCLRWDCCIASAAGPRIPDRRRVHLPCSRLVEELHPGIVRPEAAR